MASEDAEKPKPWAVLQSLNSSLPSYELTKMPGTAASTDIATAGLAKPDEASPNKGAGGSGYLFGRHRECDIVVNNQQLSKRHCLLFKEFDAHGHGDIYIEDMSTNGTYVNGEKITKNKRCKLQDGDQIQLAKYDPKRSSSFFDDKFWVIRIPKEASGSSTFDDLYAIADALGAGNFAVVKIAKKRDTGENFAVKMVEKKRFKGKPKMAEAIKQEVAILTAINHPCVIQIAGVFDTEHTVNIVMELARGGELFDLIIDKKKFTEDEARVIMFQLLSALQYLHERNIVHRDLKPENILLVSKDAGDLRIKISDFGLAKLVGEDSFMKTLCGTPNYVAPEVLSPAVGRAYRNAVDLWSCGVILYICLCGFPPFSEDLAPPSMSEQIKQGKYNFPRPFWDNVSPEAIDLIQQLIKVDPDSRLTAATALEHPWFQMRAEVTKKDPSLVPILSTLLNQQPDFKRGDTIHESLKEVVGNDATANGSIKRKVGGEDEGDRTLSLDKKVKT